MSFGIAQEAKASWGSPAPGLGGRGPRAIRISKSRPAHALQLLGPSPQKRSGGLQHTRVPQNLRAREAMEQGMSRMPPIRVGMWQPDSARQAAPTDTASSAIGARTSPYRTRLTGPVHFLKKLFESWELESTSATVLLGMDTEDASQAADVLAGRAILKGRDAKDRITHLYQIRKTLSALFRDVDVENQWLREPHTMLNESSPMDLLLEGSMENLLLVREYVEAAAGR